MTSQVLNNFTLCYKHYALEEIALEGLDGITIEQWWMYMEKRVSRQIPDKLKARIWNFVLSCEEIQFYNLPEPKETYPIINRFEQAKDDGSLKELDDYLDGHYEYCPVKDDYGSCKYFNTRILLDKKDNDLSNFKTAFEKYGNNLVMVASMEERGKALGPDVPIEALKSLSQSQYCLLELVGKSRENGQPTSGKTNVKKIYNDPRQLFYKKKTLHALELIRALPLSGTTKTRFVLLQLKRLHKSLLECLPENRPLKVLVDTLLNMPGLTGNYGDLERKDIINTQTYKRFCKLSLFKAEQISQGNMSKKNSKYSKTIQLVLESDEEDDDDEETTPKDQDNYPQSCYNIGEPLDRQAYKLLQDAGSKGLTLRQMTRMLGIDYKTAECLCDLLKSQFLVRLVLEDQGRQKLRRYIITIPSSPAGKTMEDDNLLIEEILKFKPNPETENASRKRKGSPIEADTAAKIAKEAEESNTINEMKKYMVEEKCLVHMGLFEQLKTGKRPTTRQLKLANATVKVLQKYEVVTTYHSLSKLACEEANVEQMDTKSFKVIVHKLYKEGFLKIYRIEFQPKTPRIIIMAPHVTLTDPKVKNKYDELSIMTCTLTLLPKEEPKEMMAEPVKKQRLKYEPYQKFLRARKLHEYLFDCMYGPNPLKSDLPEGFGLLLTLIPDMPLYLALGHVTMLTAPKIAHLRISNDMTLKKLKDCPATVMQTIVRTPGFQVTLKQSVTILAALGLLQFCNNNTAVIDTKSTLATHIFFVNRNARIIDTTGDWPRDETNIPSLEIRYRFCSAEDVTKYWEDVFKICMDTKLPATVAPIPRCVYPPVPVRFRDEVTKHDVGILYGDGLGPCGFDKTFTTMTLEKYWYMKNITQKHNLKRPEENIPQKPTTKLKSRVARKPRKKKLVAKTKKAFPRSIRIKRKKPSVYPIAYSQEDDELLMICDVAVTIMTVDPQPITLRIKNMVAAQLLITKFPEITPAMVHIRYLKLVYLNKQTRYLQKKAALMNEIKRRVDILTKYEGVLQKLRDKFVYNLPKFFKQSKLPTMEFVWVLYQIKKSANFGAQTPCVAKTLDEFNKKYSLAPVSDAQVEKIYKMSPNDDIRVETAKETIVLALNQNRNLRKEQEEPKRDQDESNKLYSFLSQYDEETLLAAVEKLRRSTAVALKEKNVWDQMYHHSIQKILSSSYNAAVSHFRLSNMKYLNRFKIVLNADFPDEVAATFTSELPNPLTGDPKTNCVVFEAMATGELELKVQQPPVVNTNISKSSLDATSETDMDFFRKYRNGTVAYKCKQKRLTLPSIDYDEIYRKLESDAIVYKLDDDAYSVADDCVLQRLDEVKEKGCTFDELLATCPIDETSLHYQLLHLEEKKVIRRIGYEDNRVILTKYTDVWSVELEGKRIIPYPWITLDVTIDAPLLFQWCGILVNKIFEKPGMNLVELSSIIAYIPTRYLHELCILLEKLECVQVKVYQKKESDLFSDDNTILEIQEHNLYCSLNNIIVLPTKQCYTKYCYARHVILTNFS